MSESKEAQISAIQKSIEISGRNIGRYSKSRDFVGVIFFVEIAVAIILFGYGLLASVYAYSDFIVKDENVIAGVFLMFAGVGIAAVAQLKLFVLNAFFDIADNSHDIKDYLRSAAKEEPNHDFK